MSVRELLAELAGIGETVLLYHDGGKGRPRARRMLTDTTPTHNASPTSSHPPLRTHPLTSTSTTGTRLGNTPTPAKER